MAVLDVFVFQVKPGKEADVSPLVKEVNEYTYSYRKPKGRLFITTVGGQDFLTRTVIIEYDTLQAWTEDAVSADISPNWLAMRQKIFGPDAPWTPVSRSLLTEVDVG
jgi:hypothetical protein